MRTKPSVIVFDVNETLSDLTPIAARFTDIGAPAHLAKWWFAALLRDGFALTAAGSQESFANLGRGVMRGLLSGVQLDRGADAAIDHVMAGFMSLLVHSDVPDGIRALRAAGYRLVTLSNGSAEVAEQLFTRANIRGSFEALMSVEDAGAWKPARIAYEYAARQCNVETTEMLLVAVHPWDIDGAARAGMTTAWINRAGATYPSYFTPPTYSISDLRVLSTALAR